jgi:PhzF family phenazine biosynthesis protein
MEIPIYQLDAFTSEVFGGNPAAVCPLDSWPDDGLMQSIAAENNLSETAFFVPAGAGTFQLRWFTPLEEVDLCGHATLAAAHVLFEQLGFSGEPDPDLVRFNTKSGELVVSRTGRFLHMDFPSKPGASLDAPESLVRALGAAPVEALDAGRDYMAVFEDEEDVRRLAPDMQALKDVDRKGIIVTAPGRDSDFVSRFFAPAMGIPEDPVTGSSHCTLAPYWSERLDKYRLFSRQVSARGGELVCENLGERVAMYGRCALYMRGTIIIDRD